MSVSPDMPSVELGCKIIDEAIWSRQPEVRGSVSEIIDDYLEGLPFVLDEEFQQLAPHLLATIDSAKLEQQRAFWVAERTYAASQLILCLALQEDPVLQNGALLGAYTEAGISIEESMKGMHTKIRIAYSENPCFKSVLEEFRHSIDPCAEEPAVFELFGGFVLQSAGLGELQKPHLDMEYAAECLAHHEGDLWSAFLDEESGL